MAGSAEQQGRAGRRQPRARPSAALRLTCCGANLLEASIAVALGVRGGAALSPQAAAPPPLGLFSDLRWLVVYERSWPTFAAGLTFVLLARSALSALQLHLAWPKSAPAPRHVLTRLIVFDLALVVVLGPFALLLFGLAAFPVSWLYFAAVPSAVVCSLLLHEGAFAKGWWRRAPRPSALAWMAATVFVVTIAAGIISLRPSALALPLAVATGWVEATVWVHIADAVAGRASTRFVPVAPALLIAFLGGAIGGAWVSFSAARPHPHPPEALPGVALEGRLAVLVVGGFSSTSRADQWPLTGLPPHAVIVPYSYSGARENGMPLAYTAASTHDALSTLSQRMAQQVASLARRTGRRVDIVAVSEGTAVTATYLALHKDAPVRDVVLVSPLLHAGSVTYPPRGKQGWGMVAGRGLQLLSTWLSPLSSQDLSPSQPFLRSLVALAPNALRADCTTPCRRRVVAIVPLADTVAGTPTDGQATVVVVPAFHGANLSDPTVQRTIAETMRGLPVTGSTSEADLARIIAGLASAWRVPSLRETS
jgi:hypothetical protein